MNNENSAPNTSKANYLISNAGRLYDLNKHGWPFHFQDTLFILKSLGLVTTSNIYNLDVAMTHLYKLSGFINILSFQTKIKTLEYIPKLLTIENAKSNKSFFKVHLSTSRASHTSTRNFLIDNQKFDENPIYGLFGGIPPGESEHYGLLIHKKNPNHYGFLTLALTCIIQQNSIFKHTDSIKGLKSFYTNIRYLASLDEWHQAYKNLVITYFKNHQDRNSAKISELILDYQKSPEIYESVLDETYKGLLKKLTELYTTLSEYISFNKVLPTPNLSNTELTPTIPNSEIFIEPDTPNSEEIAEAEEKFHQHLGLHRSEKEAQMIWGSNDVLCPAEIKNLETFINSYKTESVTRGLLIKKLIWALELYYSIPIGIQKNKKTYSPNSIPAILVGTPEIDFSSEDMDGKNVISLELGLLFLPTPLKLNTTAPTQHVPLPLHQCVVVECQHFLIPRLFSI